MGLLYVSVLGTPEVVHDGSSLSFALRKAQALLLYLAVEGGMYSRRKLAALLWPDTEFPTARTALANALALLRRLLADPEASPNGHSHLLCQHDLLGLNPQAPLWLDVDVVQQAYQQALPLSPTLPEQEHASLVSQVQHALSLVRGPFLDGFWLKVETGFDQWRAMQQQHWQVRLQLLFNRLSRWQEEAGQLEQAQATLTRWLELDPLSEEASQRLMRVHLARGDASAALQVYATLRAHLAEELQVKPSADTIALAEQIRATQARSGSRQARPSTPESQPPGELVAPLVGRGWAFGHLVASFEKTRRGQPQAVLLLGEAGIGKTRLAREFRAWARAQGADILVGHAFELGGGLPYQALVEAIGLRLEAENAPEDLLDDLWLAELSRLLPELRVRYPDLPTPTQDELTAKLRLFEAVARLLDALARRTPLVLLLEDLQWLDGNSLDLLRYLGHYWSRQGSRVLLLGTVRREGLELRAPLAPELCDLGRDLPLSQVSLQPLSQAETLQLVEAVAGACEAGPALPSAPGASPSQESERKLSALGDVLFAQTGGWPLYLLELLKLLREREWLVPRLYPNGTWRLEPTLDIAQVLEQERSQPQPELLPASVRALVLTYLAKLSPPARQLVQASAVLRTQATAACLWQVSELGVQVGLETLEEAVGLGLLVEEAAGRGQLASYRFAHELVREVVYSELGAARRQVLHQRALTLLQAQGARAAELAVHARLSGEAEAAYRYSLQAGDEAAAVSAVADAIRHYEQARALLREEPRLQAVLSAPEVEHLYVSLGRAYVLQQAWQQAEEAYDELVSYGQSHQLPTLVSMTLNRLAMLAVQQANDRSKVHAFLEEAGCMAQMRHDQKALAETEWNVAQIISTFWSAPTSALAHGEHALELACGIQDQELEARCLSTLGVIHILKGDFERAMPYLAASLGIYVALGTEPTASRELSLPHFVLGAPPTQSLTNRASEAWCWGFLAYAQVQVGQVQQSIYSGRRSLTLSQQIKNVWVQIHSTFCLTYGLLEAGAYEEALLLTQPSVALARTLPPMHSFQRLLAGLGGTYQALQQWQEAQAPLQEAVAVAEALDLPHPCVPALSRLCMNCAVAEEWQAASHYALQAIALRRSIDATLISYDFYRHYETEVLLREGEESQARTEVQRLGERVGTNRRFRLPYLRSLALLAAWDGHSKRAIDYLSEAAQLAADLGLPAERWQIQAALGTLYEAEDDPEQARTAFAEAARIIQGLAEGIKDEKLRSRFLAGPQIQPVLQQAQLLAKQVPSTATRK